MRYSFLAVAGLLAACDGASNAGADPCASAAAGNSRCNGTTLQTCNGTTLFWETSEDCAAGNRYCTRTSDTTAACQNFTTSCDDRDTRCLGDTLQRCYSNQWDDRTNCAPDMCQPVDASTAQCQRRGVCILERGQVWVCDGNAATECSGATIVGVVAECDDLFGDGEAVGVCYDFGGSWGSDCIMPLGAPCAPNYHGDEFRFGCGDASGPDPTMGCDWADGICETFAEPCTSAAATPYCDGDRVVRRCHTTYQQPVSVNCAHPDLGGGTCANGICEHGTAGAPCSNHASLDLPEIRCRPPLSCRFTNGEGECR